MASAFRCYPRMILLFWDSSESIAGGLVHLLPLAQGCIMVVATSSIVGLSLLWTLARGMGAATFVAAGIGGQVIDMNRRC